MGEVKVRHANDVFLGGNSWVQVWSMPDWYGYTYTVCPKTDSQSIAILPFRRNDNKLEFLGRFEVCPAHSDDFELCSITGGYEPDKFTSLDECALGELHEEGGFISNRDKLMYLGIVRPSKASMVFNYLYAVDVTGLERVEAPSDGTEGENGAWCDWVNEDKVIFCKDPLLTTMYTRLLRVI